MEKKEEIEAKEELDFLRKRTDADRLLSQIDWYKVQKALIDVSKDKALVDALKKDPKAFIEKKGIVVPSGVGVFAIDQKAGTVSQSIAGVCFSCCVCCCGYCVCFRYCW